MYDSMAHVYVTNNIVKHDWYSSANGRSNRVRSVLRNVMLRKMGPEQIGENNKLGVRAAFHSRQQHQKQPRSTPTPHILNEVVPEGGA